MTRLGIVLDNKPYVYSFFHVKILSLILLPLALITGILDVNPAERMKLPDIMSHPWCVRYLFDLRSVYCNSRSFRPSQVAKDSGAVLAQKLTQSLRANGDIGYMDPHGITR